MPLIQTIFQHADYAQFIQNISRLYAGCMQIVCNIYADHMQITPKKKCRLCKVYGDYVKILSEIYAIIMQL